VSARSGFAGSNRDDSDGEVVDLRDERSAPALPRERAELATDAAGRPANDPMGSRRRRRWIVVGILVGLVAAFVLEKGVGQVTHDTRQQHLAYDLTQPAATVHVGDALANLQIPSIGLNEIVVEGGSASQLRSGPGHVEGTAGIGGRGNAVIVGRRQRYGGPFAKLDRLKKGAEIAIQDRLSQVHLYAVKSVTTVPNSSRAPVEVSRHEQLTLVTSTGGWFPQRRVMVIAVPAKGYAAPIGKPSKGGAVSKSTLDQRPTALVPGGLLVWAMILLLVIVVVLAIRELNRRYSVMVTVAVIAPVVALLALVAFYSLDIIIPSTV
jgi:sortase A